MPFGLKLRRTKRYNVLSKNCFVVTIYLLDNVKIELTQSMDNTGLHCLEATAQRLGLEESSYFGLWYFAKDHHSRWVDLEKSLKKQLEKYASEHVLYFGVMFYVPSVYHPKEGNVRYQYYLQLKKDVLEERFQCTVEQYIFLAALAILVDSKHDNRAEAQDSFLEKVFPVAWTKDKDIQEELYNKLEMKHKALSGISAEEAEMLYIKEVEYMDGYSQECFHVKDSHGNNVNLCTFFLGIFVEDSSGQPTAIYRWNDIGNITHNKSTIVLELNRKEETVPFHTDDIENSKYMSRLFATRLKFYKDNKIYTEQTTTPPVVRRRPTWKRTSMSRQQSIHPQRHIQNNEIYISEDIFHMNEEPVSYRPISQTSLDGYPEMNFINGTVPNGSVSSSHSINSLNHLQNLTQASPRSSNLSITASDIMALDFRAKCRHSATIVPSYRPTPEYDTVMRQKNRGILPHDNQSQPLRNLNMGNAHAYRHRDSLVYGQAEVPERLQYVVQYGSHGSYNNKPMNPSEHMAHIGVAPSHEHIESISHTVSTPELANVLRHPTQCFNSARKLRNRSSLPPPQYPQPRPASSTPDLASHRHKYVSSSSPDLVTRKVQQSVKTFQEDSAPVARQSFQETSELLMRPTHRPTVKKRHSLEVVNNMVCGMEAMAIHSLNAPLPRRNTLRELVHTEEATQKDHEVHHLPMYHHKKNISDATMLIHSSDSEEDEEEAHTSVPHACSANRITYSYQLQAALARMPNKPPPEYPGPRKSISNGALRHDPSCISAAIARTKAMSPRVQQAVHISRNEQATLNGTSLGPSLSEPDLTSVKERVKKEPVKERPVSEMFSIEDTIVEKEIMLRNLERSKVASLEAQKRPLMLAALNGLSASRFPVPEDKQAETTKMPMDERYRALRRKLEEGMVFTEYENLPKRKPDGVFTTALLPENQERNRIREVIPYEENRVELVPTKENLTGYINASHIKVTVGKEDLHYIATQSPLPHTFHEFWQMVWEQGVNVIAMMSTEEEEGRDQSHRYWPKLASRQNSATYGKFKVTTNFRTDAGPHAITGLKLNHLLSGQERTVWHLQFTDWPDHGCPEEAQGFLSYLEEINVVYSHAKNTQDTSGPRNPPVVVHCSAGVGRTGVLILTDLMSRCWEINENVEIPAMLKHLRDQRMFMVQTIAQYKFVYQVLIQFIESTRLV
ncbi:tyrosine-protein phosphatase non-receptor type 14 [Spea bombifrons]|uniref:tyrosine-protein phosphatase non-receptor type 14 n=1 Tax=Spea bombifrons TaxID=233779 RepID=UPI00234AC8B4|nr:tyrosine-protein phosphatase non-receptor type 14 [Spea bombifrons]